jgi:plasmid stability protein
VTSLTVRNIPDDAKLRFRQVAAAHGRSMEEHLRQLVINAGFDDAPPINRVAEARHEFNAQRPGEDIVRQLIKIADGAGEDLFDKGKYAQIRFMTAKDAMAELRRLANGVDFDAPPRLSTQMEAPQF